MFGVLEAQNLIYTTAQGLSAFFVFYFGIFLSILAALLGLSFGMRFMSNKVLDFMHSSVGTKTFQFLGRPALWADWDSKKSRERLMRQWNM